MPRAKYSSIPEYQARRPNQQNQRRQQRQAQQNQQPSNTQYSRQSRPHGSADHKSGSQQTNNGPMTRASYNKQIKSESAKDDLKVREEQQAALISQTDNREQNLAALHKDMEEILDSDVYCAICREVYVNPIILNCSHSFCKFCLTHWLNKQVCCPSCRMAAVFQTENLALRNTICKMISNTSAEYKKERANLVKARQEAEAKAQADGLIPLMEKKEAELAAADLGHRTRNNGRRRRVIGQWKGPNGATIWRTSVMGDKVMRHDPEDTGEESSAESENYSDDLDILGSPNMGHANEDARMRRMSHAHSFGEYSYEERQRNAENIIRLYNGDFREDDSDSNDSEFVAPEVTTSDEEFDNHMSDNESLGEGLTSEASGSDSDSETTAATSSEDSDEEFDNTDTEISASDVDETFEQSDHNELEDDEDSDDESDIIIDNNESDGEHRHAQDDSSDSMDWDNDSDDESVRAGRSLSRWSPDSSNDNYFRLPSGVRVLISSNEYQSESDDSY